MVGVIGGITKMTNKTIDNIFKAIFTIISKPEEKPELPERECLFCKSKTISEEHYDPQCQTICCNCCTSRELTTNEKCESTFWKQYENDPKAVEDYT